MRRSFRSDNNAGLCPEAVQAIINANDGSHQIGYGDDVFTERAVYAFRVLFGPDIGVWFVATGTAANVLAIAALTEPWQQVVCYAHSHWADDESTAPERITHCRTIAVEGESSKLTPAVLARALQTSRGDVHQPQPGVVTVSNSTEFGEVYTPDEMGAICDMAHGAGYRVHVDGARLANAVAHVGCDVRDLTSRAGVDALSFGATKNGLACSEAVVLFPQRDGQAYERAKETIGYHRKGTGHLLSKHRFISAPFGATLRDGIWLRHAAHANAMAALLGEGLAALGLEVAFPVQSNAVFLAFPAEIDRVLQAAGHGYYSFPHAGQMLSRLMCSFDTERKDVQALLADAGRALHR